MNNRLILVLLVTLLFSCEINDINGVNQLVPATADQDPYLPQIEIIVANKTRKIHLETFGDTKNPVMFVLHGSITDYKALRFFTALSDRYFVVLWDRRGCGLSERITEDEFSFSYTNDEINYLKKLYSPSRKINLIGHSYGGMYVSNYISRNPDKVDKAVLLEPGPLSSSTWDKTRSQFFKLDLFDIAYNDQELMTKYISASDHIQMDYRLGLVFHTNTMDYFIDKNNKPTYTFWRASAYVEYLQGLAMDSFDFTKGLENFNNTVLILGSEASALGYEYQKKYVVPEFNSSILKEVKNAGHRMTVEQPEQVLVLVNEYLNN